MNAAFKLLPFLLIPAVVYAGTGGKDMKDQKDITAQVASPDNFYFEITGGVLFFDPPTRNYINLTEHVSVGGLVTAGGINSEKTGTWNGTGGGTFGYIINHESDPVLGKNLRVQVSGDYFGSDVKSNGTLSDFIPGNNLVTTANDGSHRIAVLSRPFAPTINTLFTTKYNLYDLNFKLKSDYDLADRLSITPTAGLTYKQLNQGFYDALSNPSPLALGASAEQSDDIHSSYLGALVGAELHYKITDKLTANLGTEISGLWDHSTYKGVINANPVETSQIAPFNQSTANDTNDSATFIDNSKGGFTYNFGPVQLTIEGNVNYWDSIATLHDATYSVGEFATKPAAASPTGPSHIVNAPMVNYGANLKLVIPF